MSCPLEEPEFNKVGRRHVSPPKSGGRLHAPSQAQPRISLGDDGGFPLSTDTPPLTRAQSISAVCPFSRLQIACDGSPSEISSPAVPLRIGHPCTFLPEAARLPSTTQAAPICAAWNADRAGPAPLPPRLLAWDHFTGRHHRVARP